jgi:hypothetical protein
LAKTAVAQHSCCGGLREQSRWLRPSQHECCATRVCCEARFKHFLPKTLLMKPSSNPLRNRTILCQITPGFTAFRRTFVQVIGEKKSANTAYRLDSEEKTPNNCVFDNNFCYFTF